MLPTLLNGWELRTLLTIVNRRLLTMRYQATRTSDPVQQAERRQWIECITALKGKLERMLHEVEGVAPS